MTPIPARLMRGQTEACPTRPRPTERERQRRAYILDAARRVFIEHGRFRTTLRDFAVATGLTQAAIRNQVSDMDHLFALTLAKYLDGILCAISAVQRTQDDLHTRRRAEYLRVTRGCFNVPTPLHFLWMRERYCLPDDELEPLEQAMHNIGYMLAGDDGPTALLLLDSVYLNEAQIETMLAAHTNPAIPAEAPQAGAPENEPRKPAAAPKTPFRSLLPGMPKLTLVREPAENAEYSLSRAGPEAEEESAEMSHHPPLIPRLN